MPIFKPKAWVTPKTLQEASEVLESDKAKVISGGTAVYELAKRGMIPQIDTLVDISQLNLNYLSEEADGLHIGATTKLAWLLDQPVFDRSELMGLKEALRKVKPVQVRNVAMIGGAVSVSIAFLDLPPALLGHAASVKIIGPSKERIVPLEAFWLDYLLPDLRKGEFLSEVFIPKTRDRAASSFVRLGRTASDFALVNVCSLLEFDGKGTCSAARVAMGGVANVPLRLKRAEDSLKGRMIKRRDVQRAMEAMNDLEPVPSIHGSPWYKKEIGKILIRDSIQLSVERAGLKVAD